MDIKQYEIYRIDLTNAIKGDELPEDFIDAVVLSPDVMNELLKTIIIAPISTCCALTPTTFLIDEKTRIRLDQISSIPRKRFKKKVGEVDSSQLQKIKDTLEEMLIR